MDKATEYWARQIDGGMVALLRDLFVAAIRCEG
jgi:hypothetical protein